eukprot:TRINITY_DN7742_c0_g1_i3.p1 TRINITY_DN7742_c0_g1~~TRINITY_DN7742_c0_g1_i3.p1  ORF type:complete len:302 (-),score=41.27 TRINITY_DN7742_c0_g1_i3:295-1200(-)
MMLIMNLEVYIIGILLLTCAALEIMEETSELVELEISIPPQSVLFTPSSYERVSRSAGELDVDSLTNQTGQIEDQSGLLNRTNTSMIQPGDKWELSAPLVEGEMLPISIPLGPVQFGMQINDNIDTAVAAATVDIGPEYRCLEVVSNCMENVYYAAFADGGPQMYNADMLELQGYYYWDAVGWYRLDAAKPSAKYCTLASQVALYIDIAGDRVQSPRSEVFWSKESKNDTGRWCVHPTKLFHYCYFWLPTTESAQTQEFFEDLDNGVRFQDCQEGQGVIREFYEYSVRGLISYNKLTISRC